MNKKKWEVMNIDTENDVVQVCTNPHESAAPTLIEGIWCEYFSIATQHEIDWLGLHTSLHVDDDQCLFDPHWALTHEDCCSPTNTFTHSHSRKSLQPAPPQWG